MVDDKIQDTIAMNNVAYFCPLFSYVPCEFRIQISDLCEVTSYHAKNLIF